MSSKSSIDKYEPIKLDTTILKIDIKSTGDLITKEYDLIPFHPNMSDMKDLSNNNYILFPSFVKITMNYLKSAGVGEDYRKVFTNLEKYIQLIKFITKPDKEIDEDFTLLVDQTQYKNYAMSFVQDFTSDITMDFRAVQKYEPLTDEEIITNNIGIIKGIFLPVNGRFFVLGHEYIINESKYLPPYKPADVFNEKLSERKKVPLNYSVTVEVQLLDIVKNPGMGDFGKLSCKQKKINLNKDVKEIFGEEFGYKEEIKAVLPPLTPTMNSKRGFGKLQLEWEERNKYVKAPTTEKERIELESKWTPLQKKIAQLDKAVEFEYSKIPPLWIKEKNELKMKYEAFEKEMKGYAEEIENIKKVNPAGADGKYDTFVDDLINAVKDKMKIAVEQLVAVDDKLLEQEYEERIKIKTATLEKNKIVVPDVKTLIKQIIKDEADVYTKTNPNTDDKGLTDLLTKYKDTSNPVEKEDLAKEIMDLKGKVDRIKKFTSSSQINREEDEHYKFEKKEIDKRNAEPFLKDLKERQKDVDELKKQITKLNEDMEKLKTKGDTYEINGRAQERSKMQAELLKKQTDLKLLLDKYGADGAVLVKKWGESFNKMEGLKKNISSDKDIGEKKILNDSVTKELDTKLKEIKELKKKLFKAKYFEGQYQEITKKEGSEFSKKPGERPIETVSELEDNIKNLENEYLDIANKLGLFNQLQSYITLLNENMERIKSLKKGKEDEKNEKEKELKSIVNELEKFSKIHNTNQIQLRDKESELAKKQGELAAVKGETPADKQKTKELTTKVEELTKKVEEAKKNENEGREQTLRTEQEKLQSKIKPLILKVDLLKAYEKIYNETITALRKKKGGEIKPDDNLITKLIEELKEEKNKYIKTFDDIDQNKVTSIGSDIFNIPTTGGKNLTKRIGRYRKQLKKTKRLNNKPRSLKKRRREERKKRYTRRR